MPRQSEEARSAMAGAETGAPELANEDGGRVLPLALSPPPSAISTRTKASFWPPADDGPLLPLLTRSCPSRTSAIGHRSSSKGLALSSLRQIHLVQKILIARVTFKILEERIALDEK
jgi:hypothetical protein